MYAKYPHLLVSLFNRILFTTRSFSTGCMCVTSIINAPLICPSAFAVRMYVDYYHY
ncbi:hypothetical protein CPB86DRAFT_785485, partial [Serendipita vermifera]